MNKFYVIFWGLLCLFSLEASSARRSARKLVKMQAICEQLKCNIFAHSKECVSETDEPNIQKLCELWIAFFKTHLRAKNHILGREHAFLCGAIKDSVGHEEEYDPHIKAQQKYLHELQVEILRLKECINLLRGFSLKDLKDLEAEIVASSQRCDEELV